MYKRFLYNCLSYITINLKYYYKRKFKIFILIKNQIPLLGLGGCGLKYNASSICILLSSS